MSLDEHLPPNYSKLDIALRSIGYSFEAAIADVIDNSIDAKASQIAVRLLVRGGGPFDLIVADNGVGMNSEVLKEAMRFGADVSSELQRLGKFGLGMKLASLSQARELRVVSWRDGDFAGRGWLEDGISRGFSSTVLESEECRALLKLTPSTIRGPSGTLVYWSNLYRVSQFRVTKEEHAQKLLRKLERHIQLAFHRFLSGKSRSGQMVKISLDEFDPDQSRAGIPIGIEALDPFEYKSSGDPDFPAAMSVAAEEAIAVKAHVWPPNSDVPEYKLPGGANSRQGFYIYRNDRLIQAGGWNGLREAEPHSSLARLEVDIAPSLDVKMSLDVKKMEVHLPPDLATALQQAKTAEGLDFKAYLRRANDAYRVREHTNAELPLIPGRGLPRDLRLLLQKELKIAGIRRSRKLQFEWTQLPKDKFFDLDREADVLHLNRCYRRQLLNGLKGSSTDLPVMKCLLFLLLREFYYSARMSAKVREFVEQVNRILVAAVRHERCQ